MTNLATTTGNLELNILRRLALMQHLGDDFFIYEGKAYEGILTEIEGAHTEAVNEQNCNIELTQYIEENCTEVEELESDDYNEDYRVLTDEEADEAWEESLNSYIEECITPEIDKISEGAGNLSYYITFDEEAWKRDARMDGRGHSLSSYDGHENEETVNGITFYIYRIN